MLILHHKQEKTNKSLFGISMGRGASLFIVNNRPFFTLGGQLQNSTSYNKQDMKKAFKALKIINANTVAIPVMWEMIEPTEGIFDYTQLEYIISEARENGLKLIILWFGSWKNGVSHFVPQWVKTDKNRFDFVKTAIGKTIRNLSAVSRENLEADKKAFCKLINQIKKIDADEGTVIAVQVQNEPGIVGSDRDYSDKAEELFNSTVPEELLSILKHAKNCAIYKSFEDNGFRFESSWSKTFGLYAGEYFTAYHTAKYIEEIAKQGKDIYDIPMYTNVWLKEMYWRIPGSSYPSGGATYNVLDLWKSFTPSLFTIAPDIYVNNLKIYKQICENYSREDNPLYIPESAPGVANAINMFSAISDYGAIGYHTFAVDSIVTSNGDPNLGFCSEFIDSMKAVSNAIPLLESKKGKFYSVIQEEFTSYTVIDFDDYIGLVRYFKPDPNQNLLDNNLSWLDTFHSIADPIEAPKIATRGRGMINYMGKGEFYLTGCGYRLLLIEKDRIQNMTSNICANEWMSTRQWNFLSVEEGYLDKDLNWTCTRKRNGDETDNGTWVQADVGLVRVLLDYNAIKRVK